MGNQTAMKLTDSQAGEEITFSAGNLWRAQKCLADDVGRPYLCGIYIREDGKLYATDGHVLLEDDLQTELDRPLLLKIHGNIPKAAKRVTLKFLTEDKGHAWCEYAEQADTPPKILAFDALDATTFPDVSPILERLFVPCLAVGTITVQSKFVGLVEEIYPGDEGATWTFRGPEQPIEIRPEREDDSRLIIMPMSVKEG